MNKIIDSTKKSLKMLGLVTSVLVSMQSFANYYDDDQVIEGPEIPKPFYKRFENFYVFGNSGASNTITDGSVKFSPQYTGGGGIGYYFHDLLRADFNVSYRKGEVRTNNAPIDFKTTNNVSYLWNLYLNLSEKEDRFVPYLTAGLGYGQNNVQNRSINAGSSTYNVNGERVGGFVWNTGVGGVLRISDMIGMDFAYRYIDLGKIKYSTNRAGSATTTYNTRTIQAHELTLGLVFRL